MESSLSAPSVGVGAEELPELSEMARVDQGPFVSVLMPTGRSAANAEHIFAAQWQHLRGQLADRGAPGELLDEVGAALTSARLDGESLAVAASASALVLEAEDEPVDPSGGWDTLPLLVPFVQWHQSTPPGVLAMVDRTGADIFATGWEHPVDVVEGESGPFVRRNAPGGWSQRRFQQRAEMTWRTTAGAVAEELQQIVTRIDARVLVLAGDVRAVREVLDQLPAEVQTLVRHASGARGEGSTGNLAVDVRRWYRTVVAADSVALIEKFDEELGQRDRAAVGLGPTVEALRIAVVDTLLVNEAATRGRRLFVRRGEPSQLAAHESDLEGTDLVDAAAPDALVAAAWASGARARVLPRLPELTDGVGALLRFPAGPTSAQR